MKGTTLQVVLGAFYAVLVALSAAAYFLLEWYEAPIAVALLLALAPIAILLARPTGATGGDTVHNDLRAVVKAIDTMTQEGGLSEAAKRVIHRRQEREILCKAIEQDIQDRDWNAAMILVKELAERFGYRQDAESFRTRIERARAETLEAQVSEAIKRLDAMIDEQRWTDAMAEAASIGRLYPESPRVEGLQDRVVTARDRFKHELERRFLEAAQREDTELAMNLLKELDLYLAEDEAERYREVARGVIGRARDNLGVRFKIAVQDKSWNAALEVAEQILEEFPNSRMATEVREMLDVLRERAARLRSGVTG
jgi:hypothetical protein